MSRAVKSRAVALLSGGLDSGVALALWLDAGCQVDLCLCIDYGQRAAAQEVEVSRRLADRFGLPWQRIEMPWLAAASRRSGTALVEGAGAVPETSLDQPGDDASAAAVWVPARNLVFVATASAWAEALGADAVLCGFNREEAATFTDNSPAFVAAMDAALKLGTRSAVTVKSPTLELDKAEIVGCARRLGLGPADFWSCYLGGAESCGRCESCLRSRLAWAQSP